MAYSTTLYHKTGFSVSNCPASLAVLEAAATSITAGPDLQIVQPYPLTYIDIPGTFGDVMDVDYVKVGDYIYAAEPYPMPAGDVVTLGLVFEPVPTFAGAFSVISGVIERTTEHEDGFGQYCAEDPLCTPSEPLQMDTMILFSTAVWSGSAWDYITVCATMVDFSQATETEEGSGKYTFPGVTFTDPYDSDNSVTVPSVPGYGDGRKTAFEVTIDGETFTLPVAPGTVMVPAPQFDKVKDLLRSLGAEGSVKLYNLPPYAGSTFPLDSTGSYYSKLSCPEETKSAFSTAYVSVKHKRVLYGVYNTWGLLTASGSKQEYQVEDIMEADGSDPKVSMTADLRPDGKPYFRFHTYKGDSTARLFFMCSVPGAPWEQLPIVWTGASGSWIAQQDQAYQRLTGYAAQQYSLKGQQVQYERAQSDRAAGSGPVSGFPSAGSGMLGGALYATSALHGVLADVRDYKRAADDYQRATSYQIAAYTTARQKELLDYGYSQAAVAPEASMPYQSDLARDVMGNGVIVYRYRYTDADASRIDKLLTMYGYRIQRAAALTDIYPTGKKAGFVYFQAQGITLASDTVPRWALDLLEAQLTAGARIWWEKPDPALYG